MYNSLDNTVELIILDFIPAIKNNESNEKKRLVKIATVRTQENLKFSPAKLKMRRADLNEIHT